MPLTSRGASMRASNFTKPALLSQPSSPASSSPLLVGHYLAAGLLRELSIGVLAVSLAGVLCLRVGRPLMVNRRYVVDEVTDEPGGVITVQLRADGHPGAPFAPGQFAWLKDVARDPELLGRRERATCTPRRSGPPDVRRAGGATPGCRRPARQPAIRHARRGERPIPLRDPHRVDRGGPRPAGGDPARRADRALPRGRGRGAGLLGAGGRAGEARDQRRVLRVRVRQ